MSGLPDQPINPWGRQAYNFGSFLAAISGLAAVRAARITGVGQHVDLSLHESVCATVEQLLFQYWFDDHLPYPKYRVSGRARSTGSAPTRWCRPRPAGR